MKQKLTFTDSHGNKLVGILSNPKDTNETPIIIICHGFGSNKDGLTKTTLEREYNGIGVATFRFDFFAHGESGGEFEEITISHGKDDVLNAVAFLNELGYTKIGLQGCSYGGMSALLTAGEIKELFCLILQCPVSDDFGNLMVDFLGLNKNSWKKEGYAIYNNFDGEKKKINFSFYGDINNTKGYEAAERIICPTLIIHGDADDVVPVEQSKKLAGFINGSKLIIIPNCDHQFSNEEHWNQLIHESVGFVEELLYS